MSGLVTHREQHFVTYYVWGEPCGVEACVRNVSKLLASNPHLERAVTAAPIPCAVADMEWLGGGAWAGWRHRYEDCMANALLGNTLDASAGQGVVRVSVEWYDSNPGFTLSAVPLPRPSVGGAEIMEHQGGLLESLVGCSWEQAGARPSLFDQLDVVFLTAALANPKISSVFEHSFGAQAKHHWLEHALPGATAPSVKPRM